MCGKESVSPSDGTAEIKVESGSEFFDIKQETFSQYFTIGTAADGASDLCVVSKYELVNEAGETTDLPTFITKGSELADDIKIKVD